MDEASEVDKETETLQGAVEARDTSTAAREASANCSLLSMPAASCSLCPRMSPLFSRGCFDLDCFLLSRAADTKLPLRIECRLLVRPLAPTQSAGSWTEARDGGKEAGAPPGERTGESEGDDHDVRGDKEASLVPELASVDRTERAMAVLGRSTAARHVTPPLVAAAAGRASSGRSGQRKGRQRRHGGHHAPSRDSVGSRQTKVACSRGWICVHQCSIHSTAGLCSARKVAVEL